jgi:hypothetical protein
MRYVYKTRTVVNRKSNEMELSKTQIHEQNFHEKKNNNNQRWETRAARKRDDDRCRGAKHEAGSRRPPVSFWDGIRSLLTQRMRELITPHRFPFKTTLPPRPQLGLKNWLVTYLSTGH